MFSSLIKNFYYFIFLIISVSLIIIIFFIPLILQDTNTNFIYKSINMENLYSNEISINMNLNSKFLWPTPGYNTITSPFGRRFSPTYGASTFHEGIDIGAPAGTNIFAVLSGHVTLAEFNGAGGCTVIVDSGIYKIMYCHVSPNFIVYVGQYIIQGDLIANVGPKNIYGFSNNYFRDSDGNPTNGSTTGPHLHLNIKKNGSSIDPLSFF